MRYFYRCLAAALVLVLVCTGSAMASGSLTLNAYECSAENGRLYAMVYTDYANEEDLNFTAKTENGSLEVESVVARRNEDITWFFVLDYDSDSAWSVEAIMRAESRVLKALQNLIRDTDQGMLVLSAEKPQIGDFESAANLRRRLEKEPAYTDTTQLGNTLRRVMEYIDENREICPNPTVVVITSALLNRELIDGSRHDSFASILEEYRYITTHIICTAPEDNDFPTAGENSWRSRAALLASLADKTVCGKGVVTKNMTEGAADNAVGEIRAWEHGLVRLTLNPKYYQNVGKILTITQTTKAKKVFEASTDITAVGNAFNVWSDFWIHTPTPGPSNSPGPGPTQQPYVPFSSNSSTFVLIDSGSENVIKAEKKTFTTEWIVGIAAGVLILILLIVLIIVRKGRNKSAKAAPVTPVNNPPVQAPRETVVVLQDAAGNRLTGKMRNGKLTIGRYAAKGAMLVIANDPKVSGLHATLAKNGQGLTIMDNHSTNGTKVNGTPISGVVPLSQNDSVTMGGTTYKVTWHT